MRDPGEAVPVFGLLQIGSGRLIQKMHHPHATRPSLQGAAAVPLKETLQEGLSDNPTKLRKHRAVSRDDEDEGGDIPDEETEFADEEEITENIDPRWEGLKGLNLE